MILLACTLIFSMGSIGMYEDDKEAFGSNPLEAEVIGCEITKKIVKYFGGNTGLSISVVCFPFP